MNIISDLDVKWDILCRSAADGTIDDILYISPTYLKYSSPIHGTDTKRFIYRERRDEIISQGYVLRKPFRFEGIVQPRIEKVRFGQNRWTATVAGSSLVFHVTDVTVGEILADSYSQQGGSHIAFEDGFSGIFELSNKQGRVSIVKSKV